MGLSGRTRSFTRDVETWHDRPRWRTATSHLQTNSRSKKQSRPLKSERTTLESEMVWEKLGWRGFFSFFFGMAETERRIFWLRRDGSDFSIPWHWNWPQCLCSWILDNERDYELSAFMISRNSTRNAVRYALFISTTTGVSLCKLILIFEYQSTEWKGAGRPCYNKKKNCCSVRKKNT